MRDIGKYWLITLIMNGLVSLCNLYMWWEAHKITAQNKLQHYNVKTPMCIKVRSIFRAYFDTCVDPPSNII